MKLESWSIIYFDGNIAFPSYPCRNRLDPWPRCRHSREGGNPVYFGLHGYTKSVWIPTFAGMTVAGSKRLPHK